MLSILICLGVAAVFCVSTVLLKLLIQKAPSLPECSCVECSKRRGEFGELADAADGESQLSFSGKPARRRLGYIRISQSRMRRHVPNAGQLMSHRVDYF